MSLEITEAELAALEYGQVDLQVKHAMSIAPRSMTLHAISYSASWAGAAWRGPC